jgi:hypothetical protein
MKAVQPVAGASLPVGSVKAMVSGVVGGTFMVITTNTNTNIITVDVPLPWNR